MEYRDMLEERIKSLNSRLEISRYNKSKLEKLKSLKDKGLEVLDSLKEEYMILNETVKTLQDYRVKKRKNDSNQITSTITALSDIVFPEYGYKYFLEGKVNGEYTHTELLFKTKKGNVLIPSISNGNGLKQLISLGAVTVITALSGVTPFMALDEPLRSISNDKAPTVGEILEQFTNYGFQLLIIEHKEELFEKINYREIVLVNNSGETSILYEQDVINKEEFIEEVT